MGQRGWIAGLLLQAGCALVSGLDGITVVQPGADGSVPDGAVGMNEGGSDVTLSDAYVSPDVLVTSDARAGTAISMTTMCGKYQIASDLTSFSNKDFSASFWYQPTAKSSSIGRMPIVWRGGRAGGENGWMVGIENNQLIFCAADPNGGGCTTAMGNNGQPLAINHLLHIGVVSKVGANQIPRGLAIYQLDATNGETVHTMIASGTAPNNWNPPMGLTVGGASTFQCEANVVGVIDELRIWDRQLTAVEFDGNYKISLSCSDANLISDYKFDEGIGAATADCTQKLNLALTGSYQWVPSPFP